ncbi:MAG: carbamoyltransferase HypF [Planctomycetes bacterium]|nr:carbamoyltransferase HypF [Planctomycetota bacterium]
MAREDAEPAAVRRPAAAPARARLELRGSVQGVGFRPFVHRLAAELELAGAVWNTPRGVTIEVEGDPSALDEFARRVVADRPAVAAIRDCARTDLAALGERGFRIAPSRGHGGRAVDVLPDLATCPSCLAEVLDPGDRRHRYPFTNCTHCGPRFTIIESLPYDRSGTSMRRFTMCDACRHEYEDPGDRRFHAQPIACPACGPQLALWAPDGAVLAVRDDALRAAADAVRGGRIVAIKGLGGFQLAVDATDARAVARLRQRKHRHEKPLALMVATLDVAREVCALDVASTDLLTAPSAAIVIAYRAAGADRIADAVAPGNPTLGIMLPTTAMHHLLLRAVDRPVVATSGNLSEEPICTDERDALRRLAGIADLLLVHDRAIVRHADDSVVRALPDGPLVLRAGRGFAPEAIPLAEDGPTVLALGAHQKSSVALATGDRAVLGQHIGDLTTAEAVDAFARTTADLPRLYAAAPAVVAHDLHPDYHGTQHAGRLALPRIAVQHHHAHVAAAMAEHALDGEVLGVAWDGSGYGTDGTIWGGELLRCTRLGFTRAARLRPFALPGGDAAIREPRRAALGLLHGLGEDVDPAAALPGAFEPTELATLRALLDRGSLCPRTSSVGRLFDAVAALFGLRFVTRHEGHAALELELAAERADETAGPYRLPLVDEPGDQPGHGESGSATAARWQLDWRPLVGALLADRERGAAVGALARAFHVALADAIVTVAERCGLPRVVLTGGCFQNALLTQLATRTLGLAGFAVFRHHLIPPNDGGIALGQVTVARARLRGER